MSKKIFAMSVSGSVNCKHERFSKKALGQIASSIIGQQVKYDDGMVIGEVVGSNVIFDGSGEVADFISLEILAEEDQISKYLGKSISLGFNVPFTPEMLDL